MIPLSNSFIDLIKEHYQTYNTKYASKLQLNKTYLEPVDLRKAVIKEFPDLDNIKPHDSPEFLVNFLNKIHDYFNYNIFSNNFKDYSKKRVGLSLI